MTREDITFWGASILTAIAIVTFIRAKIVPVWRSFANMLEDWNGEKARPGIKARAGVMERLNDIELVSQDAMFNSKPNHGTSAFDTLMGQIKGGRYDTASLQMDVIAVGKTLDDQSEHLVQLDTYIQEAIADRQDLHRKLDAVRQNQDESS